MNAGLNGDRTVNNTDRDQWLALAGPENGFAGRLPVGDSDTNGTVDASDLNALALNWRASSVAAASQAVPEPSSQILVLVTMLSMFGFWHRSATRQREVRR